MKLLTAATLILMATLMVTPERAEAQTACEIYRVKKGDTLRDISQRAYGYKGYRMIYDANLAEIGRNPNRIEIGMVLRLPCHDGSMPGDAERAAEVETQTGTNGVISFVTANGYLPYTDESLGQRGFITHLVQQAMVRAAPDKNVEIVFVNDWGSHLEALLPRQAFDASFPWTQPGCETQGTLSSVELYACQNYAYSNPLYEIVDGFFSKRGKGHDGIIYFEGLKGMTICRPEGYPTSHLEEVNLMPPDITLVQPTSAHECFEMLMSDKVDLVSLDTRTGDYVMSDLGLTFEAVENPHLYSIQPLQVALHSENPMSAALIEDLNRGLAIMLESGEWASIVSEGLREQWSDRLVN